ncbi:MAG: transcriptional regulator [Candidatus Riflebacteria bacterium HGW-Riflebacteria-2]|nr:MAG: transcriptional regulator [Candidatus Riflebacteria bacterium HGW-Riflebacteria-2]
MKSSISWQELPIDIIKQGFTEGRKFYECIICGREIEKGMIYKDGAELYEAHRFMELHITRAHGSVFEYLTGLDKKVTGLSEHMCKLLSCFYKRLPDAEIQNQLGIGSASTIRNHRFALKEKERQAKILMALCELIRENEAAPEKYLEPHPTATMVDDRYKITPEENGKILKKYFPDGLDGRLATFYIKEKSKLAVLRHIAARFESGRKYTEKEVDAILKQVFDDHTTLRRYLIEYGFMGRTTDCRSYWLMSAG